MSRPFEKGCKARSAELARIRAMFQWQGGWIPTVNGTTWVGPVSQGMGWYPKGFPDAMKVKI